MTYEEAAEYLAEHDDLLFQAATIKGLYCKIMYLIIAPKNIQFSERSKVLIEIVKGVNNKDALRKLGLLSENLDVYIVGNSGNDVLIDEILSDYLSEGTK